MEDTTQDSSAAPVAPKQGLLDGVNKDNLPRVQVDPTKVAKRQADQAAIEAGNVARFEAAATKTQAELDNFLKTYSRGNTNPEKTAEYNRLINERDQAVKNVRLATNQQAALVTRNAAIIQERQTALAAKEKAFDIFNHHFLAAGGSPAEARQLFEKQWNANAAEKASQANSKSRVRLPTSIRL